MGRAAPNVLCKTLLLAALPLGALFYSPPAIAEQAALHFLEARDRPTSFVPRAGDLPDRPAPSPGAITWTFLMYDDADFDPGGDILELFAADAHSGPNLDVIILQNRFSEPAVLWHLGQNHELTQLEDWGEVNMGDPATLRDFLLWGKSNYPADRYLLAAYDHGGGWRGACVDDTDNDKLTMNDFQLALTDAGPVDLLCFTAPCMMGALESVYELRDCVDVYVASEELSMYAYWHGAMDSICDLLITAPDTPAAAIGAEIVRLVEEVDFWPELGQLTMSAVDTSAMADTAGSLDRLALDLIPRLGSLTGTLPIVRNRSHEFCAYLAEYYGLIDVQHFTEELALATDDPVILADLEAVQAAIEAAVVAECHGSLQENAHGLSIYFPRGGRLYDPEYETVQLDFAQDTAWDELLTAYYDELDLPVMTIVTGPGPAQANPPLVRCFDPMGDETPLASWTAYGAQAWGVNTACGDLDGDGWDEVVTGPGPGAVFGPHVRGFNPSGQPLPEVSFLAYGTNKFGVNVACGDLDGDSIDEVVTGAGPGAVFGPHVRGWNVDGAAAQPIPGVSYFAYGTCKWGVNAACGDIDGDGYDEIVTGAGPGTVFGPHVRGWDVDGAVAQPIPGVSYFAYGTLRWGVNVACGDLDGDGRDEILTGPGPSSRFGAHVRGWKYDGVSVTAMPEVNYFAYLYGSARYGLRLAAADIHGDGIDEIITAPGPDTSEEALVVAWRVSSTRTEQINRVYFDAYQDLGLFHGGTVSGGHLNH